MTRRLIVVFGVAVLLLLATAAWDPYTDFFRLVKYDTDGNLLWLNEYPELTIDRSAGVRLFPSGDVLIFGDTFLAAVSPEGKTTAKIETENLWLPPQIDSKGDVIFECSGNTLVKWSPGVGLIWEREIEAFNPTGLQRVDDQHIFVVGDHVSDPSGSDDGFGLIRIDNEGHEIWRVTEKRPSGQDPNRIGSFSVSAAIPELVVTKQKWDSGSVLNGFSETGEKLWTTELGNEGSFAFSRLMSSADGSIVYADNPTWMEHFYSPGGFRARKFDVESQLLWTAGPYEPGCPMCGINDAVLTRKDDVVLSGITAGGGEYDVDEWAFFHINSNGALDWRAVFEDLPRRNQLELAIFTVDESDNLIVGGAAWHDNTEGGTRESIALLYKINADGEVLWDATYDSAYGDDDDDDTVYVEKGGDDRYLDASADSEGNIYVAGTFNGDDDEDDKNAAADDDDDDDSCGCGC